MLRLDSEHEVVVFSSSTEPNSVVSTPATQAVMTLGVPRRVHRLYSSGRH